MLEKIEQVINLHNNEPSVILYEGLVCINLALNMAVTGNKELLNKLENGNG